jgi:hypothetical protein
MPVKPNKPEIREIIKSIKANFIIDIFLERRKN